MNAAGIDVSSRKSTVAVLRPFGEVVRLPFDVSHSSEDLAGLARQLKALDGEKMCIRDRYVERMRQYAEKEENESCREMIEDNIQEIGLGVASDAIRHRFFLVFQYEARMKAKRNTVSAIVQRLNEEADTARRYLDVCELEVLEPRYADDFILKLLYEIINKKTSRRVRPVSYTHLDVYKRQKL